MEADDAQPPAGAELIGCGVHHLAHRRQLIVHGDADRLKAALGGMLLFAQRRARHGRADHIDQFHRGRDWLLRPGANDRPGDARCVALLAVFIQNALEFTLRPLVDNVPCAQPLGRVHAHIERRVVHVGKAALRLVELRRGDTEVKEHAVHGVDAETVKNGGRVAEVAVHELHTVSKRRQTRTGALDGRLIAVDADELSGREARGDLLGVAAHAERTVDIDAVRPDVQIFNTLVQQHGDMQGVHQKSNSSITAAMFSGSASSGQISSQRALSQNSAWLLLPTTVTLLVRPANSRRCCGRRIRPCPSSSQRAAYANSGRILRCCTLVMAATLRATSSQFSWL